MPDIKVRDTVKGTIKTIDKSAVASERMKNAYVRTKEKAEHSIHAAEGSPEEYAADRLSGGMETSALPIRRIPLRWAYRHWPLVYPKHRWKTP